MTTNDLLHLLPLLLTGGAVTPWVVNARLRRRDHLEVTMFSNAFAETHDPELLGYYAQMRCQRGRFSWPQRWRRRAGEVDNDRDPPTPLN